MKTTVFSTPAAFVRKQTIKDLRATDVSGYAHAMLIRHGSVSDLVKHELDKCLRDYLDKVFTFTEFKVFRRIRLNAIRKFYLREALMMLNASIRRVLRHFTGI